MQKLFIIILGILLGIGTTFTLLHYNPSLFNLLSNTSATLNESIRVKQKIGFLPYWLLGKAQNNYSGYITTLTYFGLTINPDGTIMKLVNEQEEEPGWTNLRSGAVNEFLNKAKNEKIKLSLLVFNANEESIAQLLENPERHGRNLVTDVKPIMNKYGFTDLNIDIESFQETSEEARTNFSLFIKTIRQEMKREELGSLTIDVSPTALIKPYLINVKEIEPYVDTVVFMTYDYHYQGSEVTGPVSPLSGGGIISEFDNEQAIDEAIKIIPSDKIILGVPLYGYEWETIDDTPRSATIPGSGITASNARVEELLKDCSNCKIQLDKIAQESYLIYKDEATGTYHQIFYPDRNSMEQKLKFAQRNHLGGVALWALGYEGKTILEPLLDY